MFPPIPSDAAIGFTKVLPLPRCPVCCPMSKSGSARAGGREICETLMSIHAKGVDVRVPFCDIATSKLASGRNTTLTLTYLFLSSGAPPGGARGGQPPVQGQVGHQAPAAAVLPGHQEHGALLQGIAKERKEHGQ